MDASRTNAAPGVTLQAALGGTLNALVAPTLAREVDQSPAVVMLNQFAPAKPKLDRRMPIVVPSTAPLPPELAVVQATGVYPLDPGLAPLHTLYAVPIARIRFASRELTTTRSLGWGRVIISRTRCWSSHLDEATTLALAEHSRCSFSPRRPPFPESGPCSPPVDAEELRRMLEEEIAASEGIEEVGN